MPTIAIYIPENIAQAIKQAAKNEQRSLSNYVTRVLTKAISGDITNKPQEDHESNDQNNGYEMPCN